MILTGKPNGKKKKKKIIIIKKKKNKNKKYIYMYTMCPPGCHHNGFMATPELGHRMYRMAQDVHGHRMYYIYIIRVCRSVFYN